MWVRWWTGGVWALAAGSALYWGFKVLVRPVPAPAHTQTAEPAAALRGDLTRVLGADPPPVVTAEVAPAADARFQLIGVVSPRSPQAAREGLALIAVDGKPPKAFRVGAVVEGANVLQSVAARGATLGPRGGAALVALNLAPPAPAATGVLPGVEGRTPVQAAPYAGVAPRPGMAPPGSRRPPPPAMAPQDAEPPPPPVSMPPDGAPTR